MPGNLAHAGLPRPAARKRGGWRLYESTKQTLAARDWPTVQNYADAKTDIVREILARQEAETR